MNDRGMSLPELLLALVVLSILTSLGWFGGTETLARQRLESTTRRLSLGIEQARSEAMRRRQACGLSLQGSGWSPPRQSSLPACLTDGQPFQESGLSPGELELMHNLPAELRFSSNGLVLDGGTVVISMRGTSLRRCLVMALPLGVVRLGRYANDPSTGLNSAACLPDPSL